MKTFTEWCQDKGFVLEAFHKEPIKGGKKLSHTEKISGGVRDLRKDLSKDYKGNWSHNGTVAPFNVPKAKGKAEKATD